MGEDMEEIVNYSNMGLDELEEVIKHGLETFVEVGTALLVIRDGKLYKDKYATFDIYCHERWGMDKRYANYQIAASKVIGNLGTIVPILPTTETQARPLTPLEPEQQVEAWKAACDLAGEGNQPTAKEVEFVVKEMLWQEPPAIPTGEYRVIYADPPWQFDNSGFDQSAAAHYPTMPTEKIAELKIPRSSNSVCFMWATNAMLEDALEVMRSWGFDYKTNFVWTKETGPTIGFYTISRHELLLIGTHGQDMLPEVRPISIIRGEVAEHSKKPEGVYSMIESMYDGPYLELFARNKHEKWEVWGNEV
jgi:N6-adenosine-specific RNA methylase IME4